MKKTLKLLEIPVSQESSESILEQIKKYISQKEGFCHIVSLNPEILVQATENTEFKQVLLDSDLRINDGSGIVGATLLKYFVRVPRTQGADLFKTLMEYAGERSLTVLLLGGKGNLANELAECYQSKYAQAHFSGLQGFKNIREQKNEEQMRIISIVAATRPHLIFAAFGSPAQELWFDRNKSLLQGSVCMGVGGGFDFLSGTITRAPGFVRAIGMEWLFRLILQPWRIKRQLRLFVFIKLVLLDIFNK